ncbi:MAG: HEAT repeat domain-containing protein [Anaerolineae bacterium]
MRRLLNIFLVLWLGAAGASLILQPEHEFTRAAIVILAGLLIVIVADRVLGLFKPRRSNRIPRSLVGEIEQLYFRSMREMLNDEPNLIQVINDLQRILSIDSTYKNAQHYLNRALTMQAQQSSDGGQTIRPGAKTADFRKLQEQLSDPNPDIRKSIVMEFIQFGEKAIDPLIALLMDEDADVRVHAATALGWVGGHEAVEPLLVALKDENPYVRRYAARALCWVVDDTAIDGLIEGLSDSDAYVRQYMARALGWGQNSRAVRPLIELLITEQVSEVREAAFTALADLGEPNVRVGRPEPVEN